MKTSSAKLNLLLAEFAGKTDYLDRIAAEYPADENALRHLIELAEGADADQQVAATGLLKRYQAAGANFPAQLVARLLRLIPVVAHWQSRLHLLQMLSGLTIPKEEADPLFAALDDSLATSNKFVRAWAYSGLHRLASLHAEYRSEVKSLLSQGGRAESASVRARIRNLSSLG